MMAHGTCQRSTAQCCLADLILLLVFNRAFVHFIRRGAATNSLPILFTSHAD
jgi:hypothetical protein